jgi:hypothetical protein
MDQIRIRIQALPSQQSWNQYYIASFPLIKLLFSPSSNIEVKWYSPRTLLLYSMVLAESQLIRICTVPRLLHIISEELGIRISALKHFFFNLNFILPDQSQAIGSYTLDLFFYLFVEKFLF